MNVTACPNYTLVRHEREGLEPCSSIAGNGIRDLEKKKKASGGHIRWLVAQRASY